MDSLEKIISALVSPKSYFTVPACHYCGIVALFSLTVGKSSYIFKA